MRNFLLVIIIGLVSCGEKKPGILKHTTGTAVLAPAGDSIITLEINVGKGNIFSFGYIDAKLNFVIIQTPERPDTSFYSFKIISQKPVFIRDIDHTKQNYFYLVPGETYQVIQNEGYSHFEVAGNTGRSFEVNALKALRQHNKASKRFSDFDTEEQYAILDHRNMDLFHRDSLLKRDYAANLEFIQQYASVHNVSESQHKILKKFLFYKFAAARLNFHMKNASKVVAYIAANNALYASIEKEVQCDTCSIYPNYDYLVRLFAKIFIADPDKDRIEVVYEKYHNYFKGSTREHLLYDLVKFGGIFNDTRPSPELAERFISESVDTLLGNHIKAIYQHFNAESNLAGNNKMPLSTQLSDYNNNKLTWEKLLKNYRGKVLYVDFWASWCGPCRTSIPASVALQRKFAADSFAVIFVSIDENIVDWKDASAAHNLKPNDSYIIHSPQQSSLKKKYAIDFIPRYFLVNKVSNIVDPNAPAPGVEKIVQQIRELL